MAIHKEKEILDGQVSVSYHRIQFVGVIQNIAEEQNIQVDVIEFISEEAAKIEKKHCLSKASYRVLVKKEELIASEKDIYAFFYTKLLELPEFEGAVSV